jgi:hypothetical protein
MAVHITDRVHHVDAVQHLFTEFGCSIKTRLGLHEAGHGFCSPNGIVILEMTGPGEPITQLKEKLNDLEGVEAKTITFEHD